MASGLVYLRSKHLVYFRAFGPFRESAKEAWDAMFSWMEDTGIRSEVACGYGLARYIPSEDDEMKPRYEACIELPIGLGAHQTRDVQSRELPGGAYARRRHVGPLDGLGDSIRELRAKFTEGHGLRLDPRRPLVEIYLDDPLKVAKEDLRVDLCLPVSTD